MVKLEYLIVNHSQSAVNSLKHTKFNILFHFYAPNLENFPFQGVIKR